MIARVTRMALVTGTALALVAPAGVAVAEDDGVERHGACSGAARWELEAEREGARLQMEFDVDRAGAGSVWQVHVRHDGRLIADTARMADGHGGFEVHRVTPNTPGSDVFSARGVSRTGQVCRGSVTYAG